MTYAITDRAPDKTAVRRSRWPLHGVAAGLLGTVATLVGDVHVGGSGAVSESDPGMIEVISRPAAHLSIVAGYLSVAFLLVFAASWRTQKRNTQGDRGHRLDGAARTHHFKMDRRSQPRASPRNNGPRHAHRHYHAGAPRTPAC